MFKPGDRVQIWGHQDSIDFKGEIGRIAYDVSDVFGRLMYLVDFSESTFRNGFLHQAYIDFQRNLPKPTGYYVSAGLLTKAVVDTFEEDGEE